MQGAWVQWASLGGSHSKESACNVGDLGLISGLGRSPGEGNGHPLQYSGLENCMDIGAWRATSMGSQRVGQNFHFHWVGYLIPHDATKTPVNK